MSQEILSTGSTSSQQASSSQVEQIKRILEKEIKPMLAVHLGSLDFVDFKNGVLSIRFQGTCHGCPLSKLTLKSGIEEILKSKLSCVSSVEAVE